MRPLVVLGLRGVGKSATCAQVVRLDGSFEAVQIGTFISRHKNKPEQPLKQNEFVAAMGSLVAYVRTISPVKHVLLESGDFVIKANGLFRCNHFHIWEQVEPGAIAMLLASPETIIARRDADKNKRRKENDDDIHTIEIHQDLLISCASAVANRLGIPLNVILAQDKVSDVALRLLDCVKYTATEYALVARLRQEI